MEDKKILFTTSRIYPYCDACGNCLLNIIQQTIDLNKTIEVFVLQVDYRLKKKICQTILSKNFFIFFKPSILKVDIYFT